MVATLEQLSPIVNCTTPIRLSDYHQRSRYYFVSVYGMV
jgi:hypothetical protein